MRGGYPRAPLSDSHESKMSTAVREGIRESSLPGQSSPRAEGIGGQPHFLLKTEPCRPFRPIASPARSNEVGRAGVTAGADRDDMIHRARELADTFPAVSALPAVAVPDRPPGARGRARRLRACPIAGVPRIGAQVAAHHVIMGSRLEGTWTNRTLPHTPQSNSPPQT